MANEPMTEERLAEIRQHAEAVRGWLRMPDVPTIVDVRNPEPEPAPAVPMVALLLGTDVLALLAEVDRLRAANASLASVLREREIIAGILRVEAQNDCTDWHPVPKPPLGKIRKMEAE